MDCDNKMRCKNLWIKNRDGKYCEVIRFIASFHLKKNCKILLRFRWAILKSTYHSYIIIKQPFDSPLNASANYLWHKMPRLLFHANRWESSWMKWKLQRPCMLFLVLWLPRTIQMPMWITQRSWVSPARASTAQWFFPSISNWGTQRVCRHDDIRCCGGPHLGRYYFCRPFDSVDHAAKHDLVASSIAKRRHSSHYRGSRKLCTRRTQKNTYVCFLCKRFRHRVLDVAYSMLGPSVRAFQYLFTCPFTTRSTFFRGGPLCC